MLPVIIAGRWNKLSSFYPETRHLRLIRDQYDQQRISLLDLHSAQDAVVKLLLQQLGASGATMITEGGIRWDSLYDVTRYLSGCSGFQQLTRIPETNHFHRQPVAKLPLIWSGSPLCSDLNFAQKQTQSPLVLSLPGPYSAARQTQNVDELGLTNLAIAFSQALNMEMENLLTSGAAMVRIEEPQIIAHPPDWPFFQRLMRKMVWGLDYSRLALASFGELKHLPGYFELPFKTFFVDFVSQANDPQQIAKEYLRGKRIVAGIVDAQHPYQETAEEIKERVSPLLNRLPREQLALSPNNDLHFLPWNEALNKVKRLVEVANDLNN